jgi:asparagine synthase (glutamine-hydrolysing)
MCGIAGILNLKSDQPLDAPIRRMTDALAHRGPNSGGFFGDAAKIALGHRRLSVIDLSTGANQPFQDETGRFTLIFNGEIYNFQDVKPLLNGYNFRTQSDTEVILAAYVRWGADCLRHLNGMFAFAIWDKQAESLFIARDRIGVKPLYYYQSETQFLFASEIRSLLSSECVPRQIDNYALRDFLSFQSVYAPFTLIKNVFQLMPGEYATISAAKGFEKTTYWRIENPPNAEKPANKNAAETKIRELLTASIERRMVSDVPLGAFLSGGIDSSAVVALMAQSSARPIDTFTVSFAEKQFDESQFAELIAKKYNTRHTTIQLSPDDFLKGLPDALDATDAPSGDGLNTYIVSKATKEAGITVALSGLGGDELFAGYQYPKHFQTLNTRLALYWQLPQNLRKGLMSVAEKMGSDNPKRSRQLAMLGEDAPTIGAIYPYFRMINTAQEANQLLSSNGFSDVIIRKLLKDRQLAIEKLPLMSQVTVAELLGYTLNVLLKDTDQFSMASALEVREPFFDYTLVEYVLTLPDAWKYDPKTPKSLLVNALAPLLPDSIVHRPKMGFVFPWKHWLLNELRDFCDEQIEFLSNFTVFNSVSIKNEWSVFKKTNGASGSYVKIWQLVVLAYWLRKNRIDIDTQI